MGDKMKLSLVIFDTDALTGKPVSYQVREVTGTVEYYPGQILKRAEVSGLCPARGMYTVTFKRNTDKA